MAAQDPGASPTPYNPEAPQDWLVPGNQPYNPGSYSYGPYSSGPSGQYSSPPAGPAPMFELRPLNLSEVLDRTFSLYRSRFWLFAGIAAFSGAVQALSAAFQMLMQGRILRHAPAANAGLRGADLVGSLLTLLGVLLFFLAFTVTSAATAFAVGEVYLGRLTTVKESFRATAGRWYAYITIAIWQACSLMWVPMLLIVPAFALIAFKASAGFAVAGALLMVAGFGGFIVGYILYLRNAFAVPAAVTERLKVRAAMRRSKVLASGTKFRIFVLHIIGAALYMVVGVLQAPLMIFVSLSLLRNGAQSYGLQAIMLIIGFIGHTVVSPVAMIGLMLLYIDQRVRKEAFDIAVLLGEEGAVEVGSPPVQTTPEAVEAAAGAAAVPQAMEHGAVPAEYPAASPAASSATESSEAQTGDEPLL